MFKMTNDDDYEDYCIITVTVDDNNDGDAEDVSYFPGHRRGVDVCAVNRGRAGPTSRAHAESNVGKIRFGDAIPQFGDARGN